jgi:cytidylate kinase
LKEKSIPVDRENIKEDIIQRDLIDSTRDVAPLKPAKDAIIVDTSNLTIADQVQKVIDIVNDLLQNHVTPHYRGRCV